MSPTDRVTLRLDVDPHGEPIRGELHSGDGTRLPFVGWLGLTAALEQAVCAGAQTITHKEERDQAHRQQADQEQQRQVRRHQERP